MAFLQEADRYRTLMYDHAEAATLADLVLYVEKRGQLIEQGTGLYKASVNANLESSDELDAYIFRQTDTLFVNPAPALRVEDCDEVTLFGAADTAGQQAIEFGAALEEDLSTS